MFRTPLAVIFFLFAVSSASALITTCASPNGVYYRVEAMTEGNPPAADHLIATQTIVIADAKMIERLGSYSKQPAPVSQYQFALPGSKVKEIYFEGNFSAGRSISAYSSFLSRVDGAEVLPGTGTKQLRVDFACEKVWGIAP